MESITSAEELTKLLRAKNTTTAQVYDIVSKFNDIQIYFPHKEIFVLELIQDRWNDQRRDDFKVDYKIWELFNSMWIKIKDQNLLKKLFKNLKFGSLLIKSLKLIENSNDSNLFLKTLLETVILINSTSTIDVSFENSCKILAQTLNLLSLKNRENQLSNNERDQLIVEVTNLLDINNITDINTKLANIYTNDLLLATLKYIIQFQSDSLSNTNSIDILRNLLNNFIFADNLSSLKLLERFFKNQSENIDKKSAVLLFKISISFLSRGNFKQLEEIFNFIVACQPKVTPILLKELSASKKTLSQDFLENLFNTTLKNAKENIEHYNDPDFWSLLSHILDLDIEIGIRNFDTLLNLINAQKDNNEPSVIHIWSKVISCHINAREYVEFLDKWQSYCFNYTKSNKDKLQICFLFDKQFTDFISNNMVTLSTTQIRDLFDNMVDLITGENIAHNDFNKNFLRIYLSGLSRLEYHTLMDIKPILSKIFETESSTDLWEIKYLIMDVYDDILPIEQLTAFTSETFIKLTNDTGLSNNLFYYFFKLREYQEFNFSIIEEEFIQYIKSSSVDTRSMILSKTFTNWSSIINSIFSKDNIKTLVQLLCKSEHIHILSSLFLNGDFFEEENIVFYLVDELILLYAKEDAVSYLNSIPSPCINKSARILLINNLTSKESLTDLDISLLCRLLENPTHKSILETDFNKLKNFISKNQKNISVFTTIWNNYISQIKEPISQSFVNTTIDNILQKLSDTEIASVYYQIALSVIQITPTDIIDNLKKIYTQICLDKMLHLDTLDNDQLLWILHSLYQISKITVFNNAQTIEITNTITKLVKDENSISNLKLLETLFLLYCSLYNESLVYLYPQYMALRGLHVSKEPMLSALSDVLTKVKETNTANFNDGFLMTIDSLNNDESGVYLNSILELYELQINHIGKENVIGCHLFVKSLSTFLTNLEKFVPYSNHVISILTTIQALEISKPYLFNQFAIETLFPLSLKTNLLFIKKGNSNNNEIFLNSTKMISNVILIHRVKLSNRNHLVISLFCHLLEIISKSKELNLNINSTKSLARLITNFCEPSNISNNQSNNKHKLSSKVSLIKQSLRKHVSIILVKYIHLSINSPFDVQDRNVLLSSIYSVFNLLSQNELSLVNSILDNPGKQYFKSVYNEYKRSGKWHEN